MSSCEYIEENIRFIIENESGTLMLALYIPINLLICNNDSYDNDNQNNNFIKDVIFSLTYKFICRECQYCYLNINGSIFMIDDHTSNDKNRLCKKQDLKSILEGRSIDPTTSTITTSDTIYIVSVVQFCINT